LLIFFRATTAKRNKHSMGNGMSMVMGNPNPPQFTTAQCPPGETITSIYGRTDDKVRLLGYTCSGGQKADAGNRNLGASNFSTSCSSGYNGAMVRHSIDGINAIQPMCNSMMVGWEGGKAGTETRFDCGPGTTLNGWKVAPTETGLQSLQLLCSQPQSMQSPPAQVQQQQTPPPVQQQRVQQVNTQAPPGFIDGKPVRLDAPEPPASAGSSSFLMVGSSMSSSCCCCVLLILLAWMLLRTRKK
jgi:hypothetical protein